MFAKKNGSPAGGAAIQGKSKFVGKNYSVFLLKRCVIYFAVYKLRIGVAILAMALAAGAEAATAYLVKPAMDDIFMNGNATALVFIPIAFIAVTMCKGSGRLIQNYMMQFCGLKVLETLRNQLYIKIIKLPVRFFEEAQVGMLMSRIINDVLQLRSSMPALVSIARQIITIMALLAVVFYQDWQLAILATVALPLAFFPFVYFGRRMRKLGRKAQEILAGVSVLLQEILSGIKVIKAFATEDMESDRFHRENNRMLKNVLKQTLASEFSSAVMEVVGAVGISLVLFYGGLKVISGESTPGTFFSFVAALALLYEPIKKINTANNDIQRALASAERVFEILDSDDIIEEHGGDKKLDFSFHDLRFEHVSFSYRGDSLALEDINLLVKRGERLALVGPSGAGKSTFVSLLPRFYDPMAGRITINGIDLREYTLASLREHISIVSQDHFLFNQSVRDNIAYGQKDFTEEQVIAAAKAAYAHDFIMSMPQGYATLVGERGVRLSGGQKQRLTIARAIAKNAPFLILDEATSALDSESEQIVQEALENLMQGRTSIVIAHRLSTVLASDRILVMDKAKIVAEGTHQELLLTSPLYARLYAMQFAEGDA